MLTFLRHRPQVEFESVEVRVLGNTRRDKLEQFIIPYPGKATIVLPNPCMISSTEPFTNFRKQFQDSCLTELNGIPVLDVEGYHLFNPQLDLGTIDLTLRAETPYVLVHYDSIIPPSNSTT